MRKAHLIFSAMNCCCCVPILLTTPLPEPLRNVSIAAVRGAVDPFNSAMKLAHLFLYALEKVMNPLLTTSLS